MRFTIRGAALLLATLLAVGCGDDDGATDEDMGTGPTDLGGGEPDLAPSDRDAFTPPGGERFVLAAGDWSLHGALLLRRQLRRVEFLVGRWREPRGAGRGESLVRFWSFALWLRQLALLLIVSVGSMLLDQIDEAEGEVATWEDPPPSPAPSHGEE